MLWSGDASSPPGTPGTPRTPGTPGSADAALFAGWSNDATIKSHEVGLFTSILGLFYLYIRSLLEDGAMKPPSNLILYRVCDFVTGGFVVT